MPRAKHHKKNMTDKEWRKRKNNRTAAAKYKDSVKRDKEVEWKMIQNYTYTLAVCWDSY